MQESAWDTAAMPHLRLVLEHIDRFLSALRALRASKATRSCRLIFLNGFAQDPKERTTGVRSSWAHAAANAYMARQLAATPHRELRVEVIDALRVTWPRDAASPDGVHFLRHRFRRPLHNPALNAKGKAVRDGLGFTAPPDGAECIGDAGWQVARMLHEQLVTRRPQPQPALSLLASRLGSASSAGST